MDSSSATATRSHLRQVQMAHAAAQRALAIASSSGGAMIPFGRSTIAKSDEVNPRRIVPELINSGTAFSSRSSAATWFASLKSADVVCGMTSKGNHVEASWLGRHNSVPALTIEQLKSRGWYRIREWHFVELDSDGDSDPEPCARADQDPPRRFPTSHLPRLPGRRVLAFLFGLFVPLECQDAICQILDGNGA